MKLSTYHQQSRDTWHSLVLVMPLFVLYQIGVMWTGGVRNGVDFMTDMLWWAVGGELTYYLGVHVGVLALMVIAALMLRNKERLRLRVWPAVVAESAVYAFFFGAAIVAIMDALGLSALLSVGLSVGGEASVLDNLVLSAGAGLYEELVFRLGLMGAMLWLGHRVVGWPRWWAALWAVVLSSLIFSAVHHMGPLGEAFELGVFVFRAIAGVLLALIFYLRGFAVAVYTHALYDVLVLVILASGG
ncbi:CPBP family intramembrane metalloprotease [Bradymonadaceae bacterium TMQ3]|uniref:CPBP family intramembrane metalloprotease n=1 Tax=Lujinxingia sediminis TaxID=2480984 RepID=A0ABY0CP41_9DELT|nr:CPBP family intramembrane glutamic endopeptidase [Lujinxingia sediminis]RDV36820.1 CPBP family intramembrane metalloprotease [Bradymonadaceae bacterium TMQ3]RVU42199.1 CPBP family intramembrane metalloprotease [Lujinxingia sediminis]TXC69443.1 CPBP family intramembrane metalloprotease [Bradymonadales bacterium TMQ1]